MEALHFLLRFTRRLVTVMHFGQKSDALCEVGHEHTVDPLLGMLFSSQDLGNPAQICMVNALNIYIYIFF